MQTQEQQAIGYIWQCVQQGRTEPDIRIHLMNSGWPEEAVDQAFRDYHAATAAATPAPVPQATTPAQTYAPETTKQSHRKWLFAIPAVLVVGAVIVVAYLVISSKTANQAAAPASEQSSQNTARENDVNVIAAAIGNYATAHNGTLPETTSSDSTAQTLDICGANCTDNDKTTVRLSYYKNTPSAVGHHTYASDLRVPDANTLYIVNNAACNASKNGIGSQVTSSRAAAVILYGLQSGSSVQQKCLSV